MGYPNSLFHPFRSNRVRLTGGLLAFCLVLCLFPQAVISEPPESPPGARAPFPAGKWAHLIVTDAPLVGALQPLAQHRRAQGLPSRVVTLRQARTWTGLDDPREAVRELVRLAAERWGTRYVLLAGDAEIIPVPLGYWRTGNFEWDIPLDLYYAAPGGDWDSDGDGILAEWEQDEPDLTPCVALGRAPVASAVEAANFVAKVIAFEGDLTGPRGMLLAAEVALPYPWHEGQPVTMDYAWMIRPVEEALVDWEGVDGFAGLFQDWEGNGGDPLSPDALLEAMASGDFRTLTLLTHARADAWSLGESALDLARVPELANTGSALFASCLAPEAADCRGECMLESMLALPDGGIVGALAPTALFYASFGSRIQQWFWEYTGSGEARRVGDAWRRVWVEHGDYLATAGAWTSALGLGIVGDPALLLLPYDPDPSPRRRPDELAAAAHPNPFNPSTRIAFVIPADEASQRTTIDVFDIAGRRIDRILDQDLGPGPHEALWRGIDQAGRPVGSGIYFARIASGERAQVLKLVLLQ